jgi:putative oxidoreductase
MEVIGLIGRLLFVAIFLNSGINHFRERDSMAAYARSSGAPAPELTVPLTGAMIFVGGALIAIGVWPDVGALLLAAFLLPAAFYMHAYWKVEDPQMRTMQMHHFFKNVSMFGASLTLFYVFTACGGDLGLMAGGTLF